MHYRQSDITGGVMLIDLLVYILAIPMKIFDVAGRWGNVTTELDVLNELHPTEWKTTREVAGGISKRKKENRLVAAFTNSDCYAILYELEIRQWVRSRKRGLGPFWEFVIVGNGIQYRYENRTVEGEVVGETAEDHG